jgi:thiol-disulfide isomerase/thioredoxin
MPSLDRLYQSTDFENLKIFAVNVEEPNMQKTKNFFLDLNIKKLEIFFDKNLNFIKAFKLRGIPTTVLINKKGEEFARIIGEVDFQDKKFIKWLKKYD